MIHTAVVKLLHFAAPWQQRERNSCYSMSVCVYVCDSSCGVNPDDDCHFLVD